MAHKAFDVTSHIADVNKFQATVAVHTTQSSCDTLDIRGCKSLSVKPPASVTSLTFYSSETVGGTYVLINDLGTAGVVTVTASVWTTINAAHIAQHSYIQMKSAGATGNAIVLGSN